MILKMCIANIKKINKPNTKYNNSKPRIFVDKNNRKKIKIT